MECTYLGWASSIFVDFSRIPKLDVAVHTATQQSVLIRKTDPRYLPLMRIVHPEQMLAPSNIVNDETWQSREMQVRRERHKLMCTATRTYLHPSYR